MANINSSLDEIVTELGDSFDADITPRKIVRSTANKIWLMLRAFSRGLYGLYQVVAALKYRFDPLYCTDDELESTMRITGTARKPGKVSLLSVSIWNNNIIDPKVFPAGTYTYSSANGTTFTLEAQDAMTIPALSFMKRDFFSSVGGESYIGSFPVSENSNITITESTGAVLDTDLTFDCDDNEAQLGYEEETLFEVRQRILTDNQRQEILRILEERLQELPNVHECTIIGNSALTLVNSPYLKDDVLTYVPILPQSVMVILTGSPTAYFAQQFLSLCPFVTTIPEGVADYGTVYYDTDIYVDGHFPVHFLKHKIEYYDVIVKYGYSSRQVATVTVESTLNDMLRPFKAATKYLELISTEDYSKVLSAYQNPSVKILSISFSHKSEIVNYIRFDKTQIARLGNVSFQQVNLWT